MTPDLTLGEALTQGTRLLADAGIGVPRLTAEVLLAHALGKDRAYLIAHSADPLTELAWIHYGRYLHQRLAGTPTQYITRRQEFYGREFRVSPDVLIPRPETEHLVEAAIELKPRGAVLDVGTGSGAIAISLALETRAARVYASDISAAALRVARENARALGAAVSFFRGDLLAAVASSSCDMITANPPYVPRRDQHAIQREVRDFEPAVALWGGEDGLAIYRRLIPEAARVLRPGGWLLLELGYQAADPVLAMLSGWAGGEIRTDLAGLPRVALARRGAT
jgi:release factor glutamine methyltransferase